MRVMMFLAAAAAALTAVPANAATLFYAIKSPLYQASFSLDRTPRPDFSFTFSGGSGFSVNDVAGVYNGAPGAARISFGRQATNSIAAFTGGGGILLQTSGPLYSGDADAPTLLTGRFDLLSGGFPGSPAVPAGTLDVTATVPEPGTWAMLVLGLGLVGAAARRRGRRVASALRTV